MDTNMLHWTPRHSLVDPLLDDEHRILLEKVNRVLAAISLGDETAILLAFNTLVVEARRHFAAEEEEMRILRYPDRERHRARHAELQGGLAGLQFTLSNTASFARSPGPLAYFDRWFSTHLRIDDRELATFVRERHRGAHLRPALHVVGPPTHEAAAPSSGPASAWRH